MKIILVFMIFLIGACATRPDLSVLGRDQKEKIPFYNESVLPVFNDFSNHVKIKTGKKLMLMPMKSAYATGPLLAIRSRDNDVLKDKCVVLVAVEGNSWKRIFSSSQAHNERQHLLMLGIAHEIIHCLTYNNFPHQIVAHELGVPELSNDSIEELTSDLLALLYLEKKISQKSLEELEKNLKRLRNFSFAERLVVGNEYHYGHLITLENAHLVNKITQLM